jgi:excisionase family DNA binding protein
MAFEVEPEWLDLKALERYCSTSERTLRDWVHRAVNPLPASKVGGKILIKRSTFDRWLEAHAVVPGDTVDVQELANGILSKLMVSDDGR